MTDLIAERVAEIAGLRALADFLDAHPDIVPSSQTYNVYVNSREELARIARATTWQKVYVGNFFILRKMFGGIQLDVYTDRELVCKPVVTGKKIVEAVPAQPEHEEDIVEWVCEHESLLADRS